MISHASKHLFLSSGVPVMTVLCILELSIIIIIWQNRYISEWLVGFKGLKMPSELQELVDSAWEEVILLFIILDYNLLFISVTCWAKQSSTCWCEGNILLLPGRLCSFEICWHVQDMLDQVGIKLPNHKVRDVVQDLKNKGETEGEFLSKSGFEKVGKIYNWLTLYHA